MHHFCYCYISHAKLCEEREQCDILSFNAYTYFQSSITIQSACAAGWCLTVTVTVNLKLTVKFDDNVCSSAFTKKLQAFYYHFKCGKDTNLIFKLRMATNPAKKRKY